jgi:DnaJ-class molecular chaperone
MTEPLTCRRCDGAGDVYYIRTPAPVIGGRRITCPECNGLGHVGGDLINPQSCPPELGILQDQ